MSTILTRSIGEPSRPTAPPTAPPTAQIEHSTALGARRMDDVERPD